MFLAEPQPTSADLHFTVRGIPVRVSAWFWVAAALLGWSVCQSMAQGDQRELLRYLLVWVGVVFVSLLVHEMGHALAYAAFGQSARVVLYHFGGLAIPDYRRASTLRRPIERLIVSAAGPLSQLILAAAIVVILKTSGYQVPFPIDAVDEWLGLHAGRPLPSPLSFALVWFVLQVNIFWPLLNLAPVPPLDGGQIVREGLLSLGVSNAVQIAGMLGVATGAAVSYWAVTHGQPYLGIMFAMLAVTCFQSLSGTSWNR